MGVATVDRYVAKTLMLRKKVSDDTKRSFLGKKCCRIPDLLKKRQLLTISWVGFKIMIIRERVKLIIILGQRLD